MTETTNPTDASTATGSEATAFDARSRVVAPPRRRVRVGQALLSLLLVVCGLVAASTAFAADPFPRAAVVLVATFGLLAAVLGLTVVWSVGRVRGGRLVVWALPLFFVVHVAALGTWLPDAAFAVLAALGCLLVQGARGAVPRR